MKKFGTGFILKKNLNVFAGAGVGDEWLHVLGKLQEFAPHQFAITFTEYTSKVKTMTYYVNHAGKELCEYFNI